MALKTRFWDHVTSVRGGGGGGSCVMLTYSGEDDEPTRLSHRPTVIDSVQANAAPADAIPLA